MVFCEPLTPGVTHWGMHKKAIVNKVSQYMYYSHLHKPVGLPGAIIFGPFQGLRIETTYFTDFFMP